MKYFLFLPFIALFFLPNISSGQAPNLGVSSKFALFTGVGAFNGDFATSVVGDIGTNVGAFTPVGFLVGSVHVADAVSAQAAADVLVAYADLAGRVCGQVIGVGLGNGQILFPNTYCTGAASTLNGNLTLNGGGNPNAIFIFQINGAFASTPNSTITLINGANLCNVFWQINGQVTLGENSVFQGTIIANGAINLLAGAKLSGRGLATSGAISTNANVVQLPSACACMLNVTCPTPPTGSFQCISAIPVGAAADVKINSSCGATSVVITQTSTGNGCPNSPYVLTRTYTVSDAGGNQTACVVKYTAADNTAPIITCPAAVTAQCASLVPAPNTASVTASDNCGGAVTITFVSDVITNQTCANRFTLTRTYRATDVCGNTATCAQIITVFDNTVPTIICPAAVTVQCASLVPAVNTASPTASDNCGGAVTITFVSDVITNQTCDNRFTLTRTYRATDVCGNSATCAQVITVFDNTPPTFLNPPANITVECFFVPPVVIPAAIDNCTGTVTVILVSETQVPGVCPTVYTLTRLFRATDNCGNSATVSQVITVVDTTPPQFIKPPVDVVIECDLDTNLDDYQAWLDSLGGSVVFDCSTVTFTFENSPFPLDTSGCAGTFRRFIRFIATDQCGNSSFSDASFTVIDLTPPTFTILPKNLDFECWTGEEGDAFLPEFLVDFEVSDECGTVSTEVVLLSQTEGCGNTFRRVYQFRATDECGNTNFVTATFSMVDTLPPVIISCPPGNVFLTCEYDIPPPDTAGVIAIDNCGSVKITVESIFSNGVGCRYWPMTKSYTYAATDECGNVSYCYQSFQVVDSIPPTYTGPDTIFVLCVADLPGPGDITDILAPYFVDNCYSIICIGESVATNGSTYITYCVNFKDLCVNWATKFFVTFVATGGCKPLCTAPASVWGSTTGSINGMKTSEATQQLIDKYGALKAGNLGKTLSVTSAVCLQNMLPGNGNTAQFSPGNVVFGISNECQNGSALLNSDGTLKNKLAANVLAMQLNIWYNLEFNDRDLRVQRLESLPVCLVEPVVMGKLEFDHTNVQGLLNLSNDYLAGVGFFPPNFGSPLNNALDNLNNYWQKCQINDPCSTVATISGSLKTELQEGMEEGHVQMESSDNTGPMPDKFVNTDVAGLYEFTNAIPFAGNYTLLPSPGNKAPLNGVTTYDLVLISKHILGWEPLNSPYKMIAADANKSGSITSFDIVELRKLILGIYDELPENTSWRFVDAKYQFPVLNNPFTTTFPESISVENLQGNHMAEDFISVKIGDVNGSAIANGLMVATERSTGTLLFDLEDRQVEAGQQFELKLTADQIVQGFQLTLNTHGLEVLEVNGNEMNASNFAIFAADGFPTDNAEALTISWNLPEGSSGELATFTIKFNATHAGRLSEMLSLSSRITKTEAYQRNGSKALEVLDIALRFHGEGGTTINGNSFELYQNIPNPFVDKTTIGFYLPENTEAALTIYDQTGRMIYMISDYFSRGYNAFTIDQEVLKTTGTLLYKLETAHHTATRKMIQGN